MSTPEVIQIQQQKYNAAGNLTLNAENVTIRAHCTL